MKEIALVALLVASTVNAFGQAAATKKARNPVILKPGESVEVPNAESLNYDAYLVDDKEQAVVGKDQSVSGERHQTFEVNGGEVLVTQKANTYFVDENWKLHTLEVTVSNSSGQSHKVRLEVKCPTVLHDLTIDIPAQKTLSFGPWLRERLTCSR
jgi:hypothetical protein